MKKGFTLSELLIGLTVIAAIIAILTPVARRLLPNQNILKTKKAFHIANAIINEMINDESCYPDLTQRKYDEGDFRKEFVGLYNPYRYPNCKAWGGIGDEYKDNGEVRTFPAYGQQHSIHCEAGAKFIKIFKDKVGCQNTYDIDESTECGGKIHICETKDKIQWSFRNPLTINGDYFIYAYVDVNGTDRPNHRSNGSRPLIYFRDFKLRADYSVDKKYPYCKAGKFDNTKKTCPKEFRLHEPDFYDTYRMNFYKDGRVQINDDWAFDAIYKESEFNRF